MEGKKTGSRLEYQLVRSARKTLAIQIDAEGKVTVRAPRRCSKAVIEEFIQEKQDWIFRKQEEIREKVKKREERKESLPPWSQEDYQKYQRLAGQVLLQRTQYFAGRMGVSFGRITIRDQKTRWGSCSAKGNLNYNWRLILAPSEVLDYVVVHELAHRKEMNHSERFWEIVEEMIPDYRERRGWLKKNGDLLMSR